MPTAPPFHDPQVERAFDAFPDPARLTLLDLRRLVFDTAIQTDGVGPLQETLKWGQPAYLTPTTHSGSTLRLGVTKSDDPAIYVHCQTTILSDFRTVFPNDFRYEGHRAVHLDDASPLPSDKLQLLIAATLTYHIRKKNA
ncbi:MAG: DUF1801 domain-containing protein [Pseudomonadota bacterium]